MARYRDKPAPQTTGSDYVNVAHPPPTNYRIVFRDGDVCTADAVSSVEMRPEWLTLMDDRMRILFSAPRDTVLYYVAVGV